LLLLSFAIVTGSTLVTLLLLLLLLLHAVQLWLGFQRGRFFA
jgi:hypothetical protein